MRHYTSYQDKPEIWAKASPMAYISKHTPPFLFLHGSQDPRVPYSQSQSMMKELLAAGVHAEIFTAEGARHGFFDDPPWFGLALERVEEFLTKYLK